MKTAVLISGGVDSSVALTKAAEESGPDRIRAYYLKIWLEDDVAFLGNCPWEDDLQFARAVCDSAGVDLEVIPLQKEYYDRVVSYTLDELRAGRTPSPDIFCNQRIKFGAFWDAVGDSVDAIVTGHYARTKSTREGVALCRAPDPVKDQTYFLSHLSQEQIRIARFPIGNMTKSEVRAEASRLALPNRDRPDSQGICFLGKVRYPDFVRAYLGEKAGTIVERETGKVLGSHRGVWFYTIGQRQGLGLGNGPWYVVDKEIQENTLWVSHLDHNDARLVQSFAVTNINWILRTPTKDVLTVKLRHGPDLIPARVRLTHETDAEIILDRADPGIAPGQFTVFYDGEECLGGGMILGASRW